MKKILAICLALAMMVGVASLMVSAAADTDITVKYGKADLALTLIDGFDESQDLPGFMNWGTGHMADGEIFMECGGDGLYDIYNMTTEAMLANPTLSGNTNIVFAASNASDGDVRFTFQPDVMVDGAQIHAYVGKIAAEKNPIKLIWKDGKVEDAKFSAQSAGRDVFVVPYEFEGYIVIPHMAIANNIDGATPATADGKLTYAGFGLHVAPDDATYVEMTITAAYACSELPAYEEPEKQTEAPTEAPTTPVTEAPTEAPTEPVTEAPTEEATAVPTEAPTEPVTEAPTEAPTEEATGAATSASTDAETKGEEKKGGCSSVIGMTAVAILAVAGAVVLKKKD